MKQAAAYIYSVTPNPTLGYDCEFYVDGADYNLLRVGDIVTDSAANKFEVTAFWFKDNPAINNTVDLFNNGWMVNLKAVSVGEPTPVTDTDWNSLVESPVQPDFLPSVSWICTPINVTVSTAPAYAFDMDLTIEDSSDPGAGTGAAGDYLIDNIGNLYEVLDFVNADGSVHIKVRDILELGEAPQAGKVAFLYRALYGAPIVSQAQLEWLDKNAEDRVRDINSGVVWKHRGVSIGTALLSTPNITQIEVEGMTVTEVGNGWAGGKKAKLSVNLPPAYTFKAENGSVVPADKPIVIEGPGVAVTMEADKTVVHVTASEVTPGSNITLETTTFAGNLDGSVNTVQKLAGVIDAMSLTADKTIGAPSDGTFADGMVNLSETMQIADAVDAINQTLNLLAPAKPANLSDCLLTLTDTTYTAKEAGTGNTRTPVVMNVRPPASVNQPFFDGSHGILSLYIDGVMSGSISLSPADDSGTNVALQVLTDVDPYAGQFGKQGFWKQLTAKVNPVNALASGLHTFNLTHSDTGSTMLNFYVDNAVAPSVSGLAVSSNVNSGKKVSGVPVFVAGNSVSVSFSVSNAVKKYYNATRIAAVSGNGFIAANVPLPSSPPATGAIINVTNQSMSVASNAFQTDAQITATGFASDGTTTAATLLHKIRIDSISDETLRRKSGSGDMPGGGYGSVYDSNESLLLNEELQMEGGYFKYPVLADYSANYLPGPNYSTINNPYRYATFLVNAAFNGTGFQFSITGAQNFAATNGVTSGIKIYAKVEGATGWVDCNAAYPGVGNPSANGDAAMAPGSTATTKIVTFGSTVQAGALYVRICLPFGSNKSFTGIV